MCGGFLALYAGGAPSSWREHFSYNGGRLVAYVTLGILAGFLGRALSLSGEMLFGFQRLAALLLGIALIAVGLQGLFNLKQKKLAQAFSLSYLGKFLSQYRHENVLLRSFVVGLTASLLPCGWLYGFVAVAAATGSSLQGALVMLVFWSGTLPVMLTLGRAVQMLLVRFGARLPVVTSCLIILAGVFSLTGHLGLLPGHDHSHGTHHHMP